MTINLNRMGWLFSIQKKSGNIQLFVPDSNLIGSGVLLGRDRNCDLVIEDQYISRKHCRIRYYKGNLQINDLGSTNNIFMDGMQIPKGKHATWLQSSSLSFGIGIEVTARRISSRELPKGAILINKRVPRADVQEVADGTEFVAMVKENYPIPSALPKKNKTLFKYMNKIIIGIIGILVFMTLLYVVFIRFIQQE